ncbi:energy transducer TonB [Sphingomonas sp. 22176]|uniref:energy transducer TonB n=1 Tax=Sphingomonas sp. 22176 TaxID=3453884 RepID=UPI003F83B833
MVGREAAATWQRWRLGLGVAALLHGAIFLMLIIRVREPIPSEPPSLSVEVVPAPPAAMPQAQPPTPEPQRSTQPPISLKDIKVSKTRAHNDFVLPPPVTQASKPIPPSRPSAAPQQIQQMQQAAAAVKAVEDRIATASHADPNLQMTWESFVVARLEGSKRYPASARFAHEEATILVRFTVDRTGRVTRSALVKRSGMDDLDDEVLSLLRRVHLPPPPKDLSDSDLTLTVPIEFSLQTRF